MKIKLDQIKQILAELFGYLYIHKKKEFQVSFWGENLRIYEKRETKSF